MTAAATRLPALPVAPLGFYSLSSPIPDLPHSPGISRATLPAEMTIFQEIHDTDSSRQTTRSSSLDSTAERSEQGVFSGEDYLDASLFSTGASGSDSAYGTLDEADEPAQLKKKDSLKRKSSLNRKSWKSIVRTDSPDSKWLPPLQFRDSDLASLSSADSSPTSTPYSELSTPDGSEFDLVVNSPTSLRRTRTTLPSTPVQLSRRHTLPRRRRTRAPSFSITFVATTAVPTDILLVSPAPLSHAVAVLTITLSLFSLLVPVPLLPVSPAYLLHPRSRFAIETVNALLSPLLVTPSLSGVALGVLNIGSLRELERAAKSQRNWGVGEGITLMAAVWTALLLVRVGAAWLFGRGLGWAYPSLFFNSAVHSVGSGLAPLLLALFVVRLGSTSGSKQNSLTQFGSLAANFAIPVQQGGTDLWWGLSGVLVGVVGLGMLEGGKAVRGSDSTRKSTRTPSWLPRLAPLAFLLLPLLSLFSSTPSSPQRTVDSAFVDLFPQQTNLLTILLMTAPRPGNPDYLNQVLESWLLALPDPTALPTNSGNPDISNRIRLVVYTHFATHDLFDSAQHYFTTSPLYAEKAQRYIEWHRDPRAVDRYDQTVHLARGLAHVTQSPLESAYVLLTEDDFPLCPTIDSNGRKSYKDSWNTLVQAIVDTNIAMPDSMRAGSEMESTGEESVAGHCGVFIATGGSGLAIRGFLAAKLPKLLLGSDDGVEEESWTSKADRGGLSLDGGNDPERPPDLVIQDCLRGRIAGCEVCAPPSTSGRLIGGRRSRSKFPPGSARNPSSSTGDRWGKSGLSVTPRMMQHHLGYNSSTFQNRKYGVDEFSCQWRMPLNGEADVLTL